MRGKRTEIFVSALGATWRMVAEPAARRQVLRSMALEACGLIAPGAWIARAVLAGAHR